MAFGVREVREKDLPKIRTLVGQSSIYSTILMRDAVANFQTFPGWWYGSLRDGTELESLMCIHEHAAEMISTSQGTVEAMALHMKKTQGYMITSQSNRHQIRGPRSTIDPFWRIFKELGRQVVSDMTSSLMGSTSEGECASKRIVVGFGRETDLETVTEFSALRILEEKGVDPRRSGGGGLQAHCARAIGEGRIVIGREGAKPAFVAELRPINDDIVLLGNAYVPVAFRTRKRLIGGALFKLKFAPPVRNKELLFFADSPSLREAAETAGYQVREVYRTIVTLG
jgi:hypothetical protein